MNNDKLKQTYIDRLAGELSNQEAQELDRKLTTDAEFRRQCSLLDEVWANSEAPAAPALMVPPMGDELRRLLGQEAEEPDSGVIHLNFRDLEDLAAAGNGPTDPDIPQDPAGKIF